MSSAVAPSSPSSPNSYDAPTLSSELEDRWSALLGACRVREPLISESFREIVGAHRDRGRAGLGRLRFALSRFDWLKFLAHDLRPLHFAIWYHDLAGRPFLSWAGGGRERASARRAAEWMRRMKLPEREIGRARELIFATRAPRAAHPEGDDLDAQIIADVDLAILGGTPREYDWYARGLRREREAYPAPLYRCLRRRRLEALLDRDRIFRTEIMYGRYEGAARTNLQAELERLPSLR